MKTIIKRKFIEAFDYLHANHFFETKKEFAAIMNISPQFLSQMLNDNTPVPLEFLSRFMQTYPVNPGFFFKNEVHILMSGTPLPHDRYKHPSNNGVYQERSQQINQPVMRPQSSPYENGTGTGFAPYNTTEYGTPPVMAHKPIPNFQQEDKVSEREIIQALEMAAETQLELMRILTKLRTRKH